MRAGGVAVDWSCPSVLDTCASRCPCKLPCAVPDISEAPQPSTGRPQGALPPVTPSPFPLSMSLFLHTQPTGRTAAIAAGLTSYDSRRRCPVSGHGTLRRPRDGKCCACIQKAKDLQAATGGKLYQAALVRARAEVVREQRREAKRVADEALKAEKAALRVQAQADRDKAKRARLKAARAAQKA